VIEQGKLAAMSSEPEAELKKTEAGLVVESEGWFVVNARDVSWFRSDERGQDPDLEGRQEWTDLGFRILILSPGQRGLYHGERGQEDFLVVSGECVLVIEGEERQLKAWDFVHCPPWTMHTFAGAGDGPCVIVMAGSRAGGFEVVFAVNEVAAKHGASVREETSDPEEAHADFGPDERVKYREGWLPS
jgi:quercetin dioxygenase-like cupin family protein